MRIRVHNTSGRRSIDCLLLALALASVNSAWGAASAGSGQRQFPPPLDSYGDSHLMSIWEVLQHRAQQEPFNVWATLLFLGAVVHTFLTPKFLHWAHVLEERYRERRRTSGVGTANAAGVAGANHTCISARVLHFLGEVEAIFGIWVVPLVALMSLKVGWQPALNYLNHGVSFNEPLFVVVIMAIASTRPVLVLAEKCLRLVAHLGGGGPGAWWVAILTFGPVLGSFITEPAAMTISALLLGRQFYELKPPVRFAYATLGLLFVNISVGGVLTHFAAPPVLMVAAPWQWNTSFMFRHFGWIALLGIAVANAGYYFVFRRDFAWLSAAQPIGASAEISKEAEDSIPAWVTLGHLLFMGWSVVNAHHPVMVIGGFLFFLAFFEVTADYQTEFQIRAPLLVGFFLAGLVVHGGLQQWWIGPVLRGLKEVPLLLGAIGLTAFNDNAAITYLAAQVPDLSEGLKIAVVAGAVVGGGLTVIANAPNPAGQAILSRYFQGGISPLGLLLGALPATLILTLCFLLLG
jgi:hypothetical protein